MSELTIDERAELEALRTRVAELERERAEQVATDDRGARRGAGARLLAGPLAPRPQRADAASPAPPSSGPRSASLRGAVRKVRLAKRKLLG